VEKRWIWPFELLDKLGEGGMGVVYRARYVVDNRHVAVKLLPPDVANATILSRFERELDILKTLRHPNIVRSFGGTCEGNQRFYAMELVEGGTLDKLLEERGKFSAEVAVQFALQMAAGLAYAHERGVVTGQLFADAGGETQAQRFRPGDSGSGLQDHRGRQNDGDLSLHGPRTDSGEASRLAAD
jgi:serine/threonine protein kinase